MITQQQKHALASVVAAVIATVNEMGERGTPSGVLYAALMQYGASLNQYQSLMESLVRLGKIRQSGDLYFPA